MLAVVVEYLPSPHGVQGPFPVRCLYVPARHAVHDPPDPPPNPRLQKQFAITVLPALEFESAGHDAQVVAAICAVPAEYLPVPHEVHGAPPEKILYVPAGQAVQVSLLSVPVNPGIHLQTAFTVFVPPTATALFEQTSTMIDCVFILVIVALKMAKTTKKLVYFGCDMSFLRVRIDVARIYIYIFDCVLVPI